METVKLNLAYRLYLKYDPNESLPNHRLLRKIGDRVFQSVFKKIVEQYVKARMVWGEKSPLYKGVIKF